MVRAGVVTHPSKWPFCGYNEIQNPRQRNSLIDHESLIGLLGVQGMDEFKEAYRDWVLEGLEKPEHRERHARWTESIVVRREGFVREVKESLGAKAMPFIWSLATESSPKKPKMCSLINQFLDGRRRDTIPPLAQLRMEDT